MTSSKFTTLIFGLIGAIVNACLWTAVLASSMWMIGRPLSGQWALGVAGLFTFATILVLIFLSQIDTDIAVGPAEATDVSAASLSPPPLAARVA